MTIDLKFINELVEYKTHLNSIDTSMHEEIVQDYMKKGVPVKLTGIAANWRLNSWTPDFFKKHYGKREFMVRRSEKKEGKIDAKKVLLQDYISSLLIEDEDPYYLNTDFYTPRELWKDYTVPNYIKCYFNNFKFPFSKKYLSWIYIAPRYSMTHLHTDIFNTSAWNLVISGKKMWIFFPDGSGSFRYNGQINPFDPHDTFPDHDIDPIVCLQDPGEVVFTPSGMWHAVVNMEPGISLTENFVNGTNWKDVLKYPLQ